MSNCLVPDPHNIRLGIIGMTPGNGHPYSWSAIFNGYEREAMTTECPFPGIPVYLNKEDLAGMGIPGAKVVMVHCDRREDAQHVARLARISAVANRPEDLLGKVDAVIIATDIGSEHVRRAQPFLEAGLPIFIDKPLCDNLQDLEFFQTAVAAGAKLLSSSSGRYIKEFQPFRQRHYRELGELRLVSCKMCKKWETYGIHALEAIYPIVGPGFISCQRLGTEQSSVVHLRHRAGFDVVIASIYDLLYDSSLTLAGTQGGFTVTSHDTYTSFREQMLAFVRYLQTGERPYPFAETVELMRLVSAGCESLAQNGKLISIEE